MQATMHHRTSTSSHAGPSGRQQEQMVSDPRPRRQTALPSRRQARIQAFGGGGVGGITISVPARPHVKEKEQEMQLGLEQTESAVDDHRLRNPLQRHERMSTEWFGCILEYEGILVQDSYETHVEAWKRVAAEFDLPRPLGQTFRRIKGVRDDVTIKRIFAWTQNPGLAKEIAARKAVVFDELLEGRQPAAMLEARPFLDTMRKYSIPLAVACPLPGEVVEAGLQRLGMAKHFSAVITAEDSGAQEVEYLYSFASQRIQRPPIRCIVIGESNTTVEAAHELGMKCIIVSGNKPVYDFSSADLVVRDLSLLTMFNLKRLFSNEDLVTSKLAELEEEEEEDESLDDQLADLDADRYEKEDLPMGRALATF